MRLAVRVRAVKGESMDFVSDQTAPTFWARIYMSGPIEAAKQALRAECLREGLCVTIEPTLFIYTGGEESGFVVGLVNYPRFPSTTEAITRRAEELIAALLGATHQHSALADTPESAAKAREMHEDYRSASCDDVARRVDECMALRKDAARYRWLRGHLIGADFDWNESGASTLVFEMPKALRISANCDKTIDDAMALTELTPNALAQATGAKAQEEAAGGNTGSPAATGSAAT
jgi:hypothetical protein